MSIERQEELTSVTIEDGYIACPRAMRQKFIVGAEDRREIALFGWTIKCHQFLAGICFQDVDLLAGPYRQPVASMVIAAPLRRSFEINRPGNISGCCIQNVERWIAAAEDGQAIAGRIIRNIVARSR